MPGDTWTGTGDPCKDMSGRPVRTYGFSSHFGSIPLRMYVKDVDGTVWYCDFTPCGYTTSTVGPSTTTGIPTTTTTSAPTTTPIGYTTTTGGPTSTEAPGTTIAPTTTTLEPCPDCPAPPRRVRIMLYKARVCGAVCDLCYIGDSTECLWDADGTGLPSPGNAVLSWAANKWTLNIYAFWPDPSCDCSAVLLASACAGGGVMGPLVGTGACTMICGQYSVIIQPL